MICNVDFYFLNPSLVKTMSIINILFGRDFVLYSTTNKAFQMIVVNIMQELILYESWIFGMLMIRSMYHLSCGIQGDNLTAGHRDFHIIVKYIYRNGTKRGKRLKFGSEINMFHLGMKIMFKKCVYNTP